MYETLFVKCLVVFSRLIARSSFTCWKYDNNNDNGNTDDLIGLQNSLTACKNYKIW